MKLIISDTLDRRLDVMLFGLWHCGHSHAPGMADPVRMWRVSVMTGMRVDAGESRGAKYQG